jgi:DNA-binding IclR family transcriptional regulator
VLELLAATPGGLTDEEMQTRLGMNPSTQRPRRIELARRGLVVEGGTRRTASGRMATVWRVAR